MNKYNRHRSVDLSTIRRHRTLDRLTKIAQKQWEKRNFEGLVKYILSEEDSRDHRYKLIKIRSMCEEIVNDKR